MLGLKACATMPGYTIFLKRKKNTLWNCLRTVGFSEISRFLKTSCLPLVREVRPDDMTTGLLRAESLLTRVGEALGLIPSTGEN